MRSSWTRMSRWQYDSGMKSLYIRDIDESVLSRLYRLAKAHHRSVQGEVRAILEQAVQFAANSDELAPIDLITVQTGRTGSWPRTEIYGDDARGTSD